MEIRVLGPLEVWREGSRVPLPSVRQQRLLAMLALSVNQVVPLDRLVEALWEDEPPTTAAKQVRNCISQLRERLSDDAEPIVVTDGAGYRLHIPEQCLDLTVFRAGVVRARELAAAGDVAGGIAVARQALGLWRGDMLAGITTSGIARRTVRAEEHRLSTIEQCLDWELSVGPSAAVVDELTGLVAEHPLREKPHAQLMVALDGVGRCAEALVVFHELRERLRSTLGVEPGALVRDAFQHVLRADSAPPEPSSTQAPATPPPPPVPVPPTRLVTATPHDPADPIERAVSALAITIRKQWTVEAQIRSLNRPEPIRLRWSGTHRMVQARGQRDGIQGGGLTTLADGFRRLPQRQVVVLGEPGAGKTVLAMLLTLALLDEPRPGEPVPVYVSLASWRPDRDHLDTWLARTLVEEYPMLGSTKTYGPDAASTMVSAGRVLPVLDGLDEMPAALHARAIDELDRAAASGRSLVVTCRGQEYAAAVRTAGVIMTTATVIEIEPVTPAAAGAYLTAWEPVGSDRWQPVVAHIEREPAGPLAAVLGTPLMVDIARTAYRSTAKDPAELCDTGTFPSANAYEDHLLDSYVAATYAAHPPPPEPRSGHAQRHYDAHQVEQWLAFLADALRRTRSHDLAWWQLERTVPRWVLGLALGIPPAVLFAVVGLMAANIEVCAAYGLPFAAAGYVTHRCGARFGPRQVGFVLHGAVPRLLLRLGTGAALGVALAATWTLPTGPAALVTVVFALGFSASTLLDLPVEPDIVASPRQVLRDDLVAGAWSAASFAATFGAFYGVSFLSTSMTQFVDVLGGRFDLVLALIAGLVGAVALGRLTPGRIGNYAYGVAAAVLGGNEYPRTSSSPTALLTGIVFGAAVGLLVFLSRASAAYLVSVLWLALTGRLPLRLMAFLQDAHHRGVLRQVGAVYQFRHARLAQRLCTKWSPQSPRSRRWCSVSGAGRCGAGGRR